MAVLGSLCLLAAIVSSSSANMGYGSVGVLSGASASSDSGYGGQARAINTNYGGNVVNSAPVYTVQTSDDSDELVQTNNNNNNYGSSNGASASAYSSNGGNFLVRSGDIGNGVQVVQVDSAPAQNIGFQIQSTVQDILRRFGITMQNNVAGISGLYQPGRSFVVQSNGSPRILTNANMYGLGNVAQSQSQYMGDVQQSQQQGMNGLAYSLSTPVVVSYKVIAAPQVAPSLVFGISSQANQGGADVLARASSSSSRAGLSNGDGNVQTYAVQPPLNSNSYSNAAAASAAVASNQDQDDSSDDSYAPAPAPVKTKVYSAYGNSGTSAAYVAPTAPAPSRNRVRYIAQKNKKYESNSNVAYEEDSS
ncbi:hypothetical protein RvY_18865 [Ramazzottius varieornatus]|uniref:Uncharacterized protein n=1 Tax=Ramazzottius varieornatus TaxID=947166 RepID=A0A1D1WA46_RAMVA|nr:hypothetical protein RvY_18865 [Ramazzottius varieornatus]